MVKFFSYPFLNLCLLPCFFVSCLLLLIAGILQIPREKKIYFIEKKKSSCFSVPNRVKTQCCTLAISVKGVVNFSKWIRGQVRQVNVCQPPSDSKEQVSTSEPRGGAQLCGSRALAREYGAW